MSEDRAKEHFKYTETPGIVGHRLLSKAGSLNMIIPINPEKYTHKEKIFLFKVLFNQ